MFVAPFNQFAEDCKNLNSEHLGKKCAYIAKVVVLTGVGGYALSKAMNNPGWFKSLYITVLAIGYLDFLQLSYRDRLYGKEFYEKWSQLHLMQTLTVEYSDAVAELTEHVFFGKQNGAEQIQNAPTDLTKIQRGAKLYAELFPQPKSVPSERMEGMISRFLIQDLLLGSRFKETTDDNC